MAVEIINVLLAFEADVNSLSKGLTPLHCAVHSRNMTVMDVLITHGADIEVRYVRNTLLMSTLLVGWFVG